MWARILAVDTEATKSNTTESFLTALDFCLFWHPQMMNVTSLTCTHVNTALHIYSKTSCKSLVFLIPCIINSIHVYTWRSNILSNALMLFIALGVSAAFIPYLHSRLIFYLYFKIGNLGTEDSDLSRDIGQKDLWLAKTFIRCMQLGW